MEKHPKIDKGTVYAACILHDFGKIWEYTIDLTTGVVGFNTDFQKKWLTHSQWGFSVCMANGFKDIAKMASKYYDLVLIDIDNEIDEDIQESLLEISDLVIACLPQKLRSINEFISLKEQKQVFRKKNILPLLGRYDKHSKYNEKNVTRYLNERKGIGVVPYNTLFMEACNEGEVDDYFIKFRRINEKDKNALFISSIKNTTERIIERLRDLQMRM